MKHWALTHILSWIGGFFDYKIIYLPIYWKTPIPFRRRDAPAALVFRWGLSDRLLTQRLTLGQRPLERGWSLFARLSCTNILLFYYFRCFDSIMKQFSPTTLSFSSCCLTVTHSKDISVSHAVMWFISGFKNSLWPIMRQHVELA